MSVVTGITEHPRKRGRFAISVDDDVAGVLSLEDVERLHLTIGGEIDEPLIESLRRASQQTATCDRAVNMLAHRARSSRELRTLLVKKGEPADAVDVAISRLRDLGVLDDSEFARQFARAKANGPGFSRRRIQAELARRGLDRALANAAIDEAFSDERIDESDTVDRLLGRTLRGRSLSDPATLRRAYGFLARRGYDADAIRAGLDRLSRTRTSVAAETLAGSALD